MRGEHLMRLSLREETELVDTVAALVGGGITISSAYRAASAVHTGRPREAALAVADRLERGLSLVDSTDGVLRRIDSMHHAMLAMADATGDANHAMSRASRFLQTRLHLRSGATSAMIYPGFVVTVAVVAAIGLLGVVIPTAAELFAESGPESSQAGEILRRGAALVTGYAIAAGTVGLGTLLLWGGCKLPRIGLEIDRIRLAVPVFGALEQYRDLLAFCLVLSGLLDAGASLSAALVAAARCPGNTAVRADLTSAALRVEQGHPASDAFAAALPGVPAVRHWFGLGESGADLAVSIDAFARFLELRLERTNLRVGSLTEPLLVLLAGAIVLSLVLTLVQPLFTLYGSILP